MWIGEQDVKARHLRRDPRASIVVAESAPPLRGIEVRGSRGADRGGSVRGRGSRSRVGTSVTASAAGGRRRRRHRRVGTSTRIARVDDPGTLTQVRGSSLDDRTPLRERPQLRGVPPQRDDAPARPGRPTTARRARRAGRRAPPRPRRRARRTGTGGAGSARPRPRAARTPTAAAPATSVLAPGVEPELAERGLRVVGRRPAGRSSPWKRSQRSFVQDQGMPVGDLEHDPAPRVRVELGRERRGVGDVVEDVAGRRPRRRSAAARHLRPTAQDRPASPRRRARGRAPELLEHVVLTGRRRRSATPTGRRAAATSRRRRQPTSRTDPPGGQRLAARRRRRTRLARARGLAPGAEELRREPPRRLGRGREDRVGDAPERREELLAPTARSAGHGSSSRSTSSVCSPSSGGGGRTGRHGAVDADRVGDETEQAPRRGRPPPAPPRRPRARRTPRRASGPAHTARPPPRGPRAIPPPSASRTPRRAAGSARRGARTRASFVANRSSSARSGRPITSQVRSNSRSLPAARMNGRSRGLEQLVRHDVGVLVADRGRDDATEQVVRGLVHERGDARVEQRDADQRSAAGRSRVRPAPPGSRSRRTGREIDVEQRDADLRRLAAGLAR